MKIRVNYFIAPQKTQILDFEVDEKSTLIEIAQFIKISVQSDTILLPARMHGVHNTLTAEEYFQRTQLEAHDIHFNAVNRDAFTHEEQMLFTRLNLDL